LSVLVRHEVDERLEAAVGYERAGEVERAAELRKGTSILAEVLAGRTDQ
jgi:hypothetical protein